MIKFYEIELCKNSKNFPKIPEVFLKLQTTASKKIKRFKMSVANIVVFFSTLMC